MNPTSYTIKPTSSKSINEQPMSHDPCLTAHDPRPITYPPVQMIHNLKPIIYDPQPTTHNRKLATPHPSADEDTPDVVGHSRLGGAARQEGGSPARVLHQLPPVLADVCEDVLHCLKDGAGVGPRSLRSQGGMDA